MKKLLLRLAVLAATGGSLFAQNPVGTWQGTLQTLQGRPLRIVIKVSRADDESLKAVLYSIDQPAPPVNAASAALQGTSLKLAIPALAGNYEGKIGADGIMTGTWTQGGSSQPLNMVRATKDTEWAIPEPPPPPRQMPADAKPAFEVATIKPSNPETPGQSIQVGRGGGNLFTTTNTTLKDLIVFAYGLHERQISGGPSWFDSEKYDISAKPDTAGAPNIVQLQSMVQKLIEERFGLKFHKEKRDLSCYAITVGKNGVKMSKSQGNIGNLPGFGSAGRGNLIVRNSLISDFAVFLQSRVLERPVVDQTGLTDRYDFQLKWTPDSAQAPGANPAPAADNPDAPPDLFTAFLQQLGLKIESTKAPVEVMVIDKVEKPSAN